VVILNTQTKAFHSNSKEKIEYFIKDPAYMIISEHPYDDNWCGEGMYFWDNFGNAKNWKNKKTKATIAQCFLVYSDNSILDFSDYQVARKMQQLIENMSSKRNEMKFESNKAGKKIAFLANLLNVKVVKVIGKYPNLKETNFFFEWKNCTPKYNK